MNEIIIKRIYDEYANTDGIRILVDRLWPRGISKEKAKVDIWAKNITPSNELRKLFHHSGMDFYDFKSSYLEELNNNQFSLEFINIISNYLEQGNVTILSASKNQYNNHVFILKEWLLNHVM